MIKKHIDFVEQQLIIYKNNGHPQTHKMQDLYDYLCQINNAKENKILKSKEAQCQLFDINNYITSKNAQML